MLVDYLTEEAAGAERFAAGLATSLPPDRYEVSVCVTRGTSGPLIEALDKAGVSWFGLERGTRFRPYAFLRLARFLVRSRVDVVHSHKFGSNVWGTLIGRLCGVPVIVAHEQTWSYEGQLLRRLLDRHLIGRFASAFVAVSTVDRDRMISIERVPSEKITVVPNAYVPREDSSDGDLRAELGLSRDVPLVGTAALLRPQKALHVLIEALRLLLRSLPETHLVIAGDGSCRQSLEQQAMEAGVVERVHFLGVRQDVGAVLEALDVAALSSDFEGTPLFAFECMAHGTPLVSTDVGGMRDILEDGSSISLVPPRDPSALASALEALLRDPERRATMESAARARLSEVTIDRITGRISTLYERLLAR